MPTVVTLPYEGFVIVFSVRTCKSKTWFMYTQTYIFLKVPAPVFILQKWVSFKVSFSLIPKKYPYPREQIRVTQGAWILLYLNSWFQDFLLPHQSKWWEYREKEVCPHKWEILFYLTLLQGLRRNALCESICINKVKIWKPLQTDC